MKERKKNKISKGDQIKLLKDTMNKKEIFDSHINMTEAEMIYDSFIGMYSDLFSDLKVDEKIIITNFMTVEKKQRGERKGRNPRKPEEEYIIKPSAYLKITPSSVLKKRVNN